ncbi:MAG TPA: MaoC family dehydratase [Gemmataceae bacterium]|nr:MaoC family dehydratase [Gemmataceae bacterium]
MPLRVIDRVPELKALVGQEIGVSDWLEISQARINAFADVTGDHQWIHLDAEHCRAESPYGTPIAHGFLTLSLLSCLHAQAVQVRAGFSRAINYGLNRVRFPAPVPAGARIRAHFVLQEVGEIEGGLQLNWLVTVEGEGQPKPALVAEWLIRLYR